MTFGAYFAHVMRRTAAKEQAKNMTRRQVGTSSLQQPPNKITPAKLPPVQEETQLCTGSDKIISLYYLEDGTWWTALLSVCREKQPLTLFRLSSRQEIEERKDV